MKQSKYGIFIEILNAGSFSSAAEKLNYTQSAISQLVQSLESELGVTLLHRGKKGLSLTTEGERLLPMFYEIYTAEAKLNDALINSINNLSGTVRIASVTSISCSLLPQVIHLFQEKYPMVDYQVIHGNYRDMEDLIVNGRVDLGFIRTPAAYKLDYFSFQPEPLLVVLSTNHHLAALPQLSPSDIDREKFVLLDDGYPRETTSYFEKNHIMPQITHVVKGNLALYGFVKNELGISMVPASMVEMLPQYMTWKRLVPPLYRSIAIACKDYAKLSLLNKLFYDEIVSYSYRYDEVLKNEFEL